MEPIEIAYEGEVREATFRIEGGLLRVTSAWGETIAKAEAGPEPRALALIIFREMLEIARSKGEL